MDRAFDLTAHVTLQSKLLWGMLGVVQLANGLLNLAGGEHLVLGTIMVCFGVVFLLPGSMVLKRLNRFVITFDQEFLSIQRGLFVNRRVFWDTIAEINLGRMAAIIVTKTGRPRTLHFGEFGYTVNQIVKPEVFASIREFCEERDIPITDVRSA